MIQKRLAKQRRVQQGIPLRQADPPERAVVPSTARLIFKEGTAGIAGVWHPGQDKEPPPPPEEQP